MEKLNTSKNLFAGLLSWLHAGPMDGEPGSISSVGPSARPLTLLPTCSNRCLPVPVPSLEKIQGCFRKDIQSKTATKSS